MDMDLEGKSIKSPEGVSLLMENMLLRHKTGMRQREDNLFIVQLPPLTEEERAEIRRQEFLRKSRKESEEEPSEFYGGWI